MKTLAIIVFLLHVEWSLGTKCDGTLISREGIANNCALHCLDWAKLRWEGQTSLSLEGQTSLSLEGCGISRMININISNELKELNLKHNKLTDLPPKFLKNFPKLKKLNLIGNPLATIPLNLIKTINVDFTCSCQILKDVNRNFVEAGNFSQDFLNNITCTGSNYTKLPAMANFYNVECPNLLLVYILVPVLCVVAIAVVVAVLVLVKYRSKLGSYFSPTPSKRQSVNSADQGHQRYASTGDWKDQAAVSPGPHANYENVFMGEPHNARKQPATDDTYYLENDATCEIYQNEQPVYCNYSGPAPTAEDDIYIIADQ
ncbi:uncharacterized protein LOC129711093 [Leucoraja erinacea]|uniref:uncharacterized protein LOC129711093 n=1 Tax=Leucoraja erinaceus TaxID=7782 RepID=UPI0024579AFA|nr:uncharacterized protein LOC129711093 [Leucoraja erinacea]